MESKFGNQQEVDFDAMLSDIDAMLGETSEPSTVEASGGTVDFDTMLSDIDAMLAEPTTATSLEPRAEDRTWVGDMIDDKSSVYNQFNDAISNDFTKQITMGANAGFEGMLRTADTLFSDGVDGEYINRLKQNSRDVEDSLSEEQKTANRKEFFTDNPDGSWSVNSDAFLDFDKVTGVMAQGVGSLIPTMMGGGAIRGAGAIQVGGKSINKGINFLAGKVGATKTLTSRPKLREFLKKAGSKGLGFGASSTSMVVGGVSGDIQDHVRSMPIEILSKAPIYLEKRDELLDQGIPLAKAEIQAREEVALELGHWGMAKSAPLAMLLGTYAGRYIEDAFTSKVTGGLLKKSLIGLVVESGTEAGEGAQEQLVKNIQTQKVDPSVKTWQGVGESSVAEGLGGFGVAGGMSVAGGAVRKLGMKGADLRQREELLSQQLNQDGSTRVQDHLDEQLRQPQEQEQQSEEQVIFTEEDMAELQRLEAIVLEEERAELALSRHRESKRRQQEILNRSVSNLGGEVVSSEIDSAYQQVDTQNQEQVEAAYAQQERQGAGSPDSLEDLNTGATLATTLSDRAVNRFNSGIQQAEEHAIAEDEKSERLLSAIAKRDAILSKHPDFHGETLVFLDEIQESVQGEAVVKKIAEREITALNNAVDSLEALPKMTEQQGRLYEDAVELLDMGGMGVDIANTLTQRIQRTLPTTETVVEETEQVTEQVAETPHVGKVTRRFEGESSDGIHPPTVYTGAIDGIDVEIYQDELSGVWGYEDPSTGNLIDLSENEKYNYPKEAIKKLTTIVGDPTVDVDTLRKADVKIPSSKSKGFEVDEDPNDLDDLSFSTGEGQVSGETTETISSLLSSTYRKAKALLKNKEIVVVQSVADLPQAMQERGRANASLDVTKRVEGLYDPQTKTTFIVADQVSKETINKVFLHEMLHKALAENPKLKAKLEGNIGGLKKVFEQVESGEFSGANKKIYEAAMSRVDKANTSPEQRFEEFLAYIVTEYNNNPNSLPEHIQKFVKDLIAQVRQALMGMGVELKNLSPADLNAMAIAAIKTQGVETQGDGVLGSNEYQGNDPKEREEWLASEAKGLDMSTPARMARAIKMGYDITKRWYHGTPVVFNTTDPNNPIGIHTKHTTDLAGTKYTATYTEASHPTNPAGLETYDQNGLTFASPDPRLAQIFAKEDRENPNIIPLFVKAEKTFDGRDKAQREELFAQLVLDLHDTDSIQFANFKRAGRSNEHRGLGDLSDKHNWWGDGSHNEKLQEILDDTNHEKYAYLVGRIEGYLKKQIAGIQNGDFVQLEQVSTVEALKELGYDSLYVSEEPNVNIDQHEYTTEYKSFDTKNEADTFLEEQLKVWEVTKDNLVAIADSYNYMYPHTSTQSRMDEALSEAEELKPIRLDSGGEFEVSYRKRLEAERSDPQSSRNIAVFDPSQLRSPHAAFDTERAQSNDLLASQAPISTSEEYRMEHTSSARGEGRSADDLSNVYPDDLYTHGVQYYGTGDVGDQNAIDILADLKDNPNGIVTIYRAVPPDVDEINHGDWVTITESYAQEHGERHMEREGFHVISEEVRAKDIFTDGDSLHEWGYHPATFAPMESVKGDTESTSEKSQDDFLFSIAQTNDPDANSAMGKMGPTNTPKSPKDRLEKTAKNVRGFFTRQNLADQYDSFRRIGDKKTSWMLARMSNLGSNIVEGAIKIGSPIFHEDGSGGMTYKAGSRSLTDILAPLQGEIDYFLAFRAGHRAEDFLRSAEVGNVQVNDLTYTMKLAKKRRTAIRNAIKNRVNLTRAERKSLIAEEKEINAHLKVKKAELKVAREKAKSKEKLFTPAEVQALKNLPDTLEGDIGGRSRREVYEEVAKEFDAMHEDFVQLGVDTGLFSEQQAQEWRDGGVYIPFHRLNDDDEQTSMHSPSGLTKLTEQDGTHTLKGSEKNLDDLLTNVLMNWAHITDAALHNQAATSVTRDLHQDGGIAKAEIFQGNKTQYEEAQKDENRYVYWVRMGGEKVLIELTPNPDDDTQDSLEKAMFEVEMLHQSLTGMAHLGYADLLTSVGGAAKQLLSKGVTLNPAFKIRNVIRDTLTAVAVAPMNLNIFKNAWAGYMIARDADSETRKEMQFGGGAFSHGFTRGSDVEATKALIARGVPQENILDSPQKVFDRFKQGAVNLYEWYEEVGYNLENANRAAQFKQSKDRGANALERNFEARDHLDFGSHGASKLLRGLTQTTAFLNARIQGLDKLARASRDKTTIEGRQVLDTQQKQFFAMASAYVGVSLAMWFMMKDDEEYQKLTTHERATYHVLRVGDSMVYIPRAFELGAVAESVERLTEQVFKALEGEGFDAKFVGERFLHHLTSTFNFNLPTALVPVVEVGINKNFFTGGVVDNTSGLREDRTKSTTSNLAKAASWLFSPTGALGLPQMTPIQADHFIRGYTAWFGTTVAGVVDAAVNPMMEGAEPEPFDILDTPVLKDFIKEIDGKSSNFFVEEFYKRREPAREIEGSLRTVPEGDTERTEELRKLAEEKGVELFSDVGRSMGEIRKALKENRADRTISGEERERVRKELINERNQIAREIFEEIKAVGEEDEGEEESESSDSSLLNLIGIGDAHADETKATGGSGKYIDLSPEPLTQKELHGKKGKGHVFYGADAVAKVEEFEGELPLAARRVVELEGFVDVPYKDQKGVVTAGVGQTGDFIHQSFMDSFEDHVDRAEDKIPKLRKLPEALQAELIQAEYRGDLGQSPTFVKLFNNGQYKQAAKEFLANDEYKGYVDERDSGGKTSGIIARMEAVSKAVSDYADNSGSTYIVKKGDTLFKVAKKYNLSVPELKKMNNIKDVSKIRVGKKLKV